MLRPSSVRPSCRRRRLIVIFLIVTFSVGGPSPLAGARSPIFCATSRPLGHRAEADVRRRPSAGVRRSGHDEELRAGGARGPLPAFAERHRAHRVGRRAGGSSPATVYPGPPAAVLFGLAALDRRSPVATRWNEECRRRTLSSREVHEVVHRLRAAARRRARSTIVPSARVDASRCTWLGRVDGHAAGGARRRCGATVVGARRSTLLARVVAVGDLARSRSTMTSGIRRSARLRAVRIRRLRFSASSHRLAAGIPVLALTFPFGGLGHGGAVYRRRNLGRRIAGGPPVRIGAS